MNRTISALIIAMVALPLATASPALAQVDDSPGMLGVGYVANAPQMLLGGTVWAVIPGLNGWGIYLDAKMDPEDPIGDGVLFSNMTRADVDEQWPSDLEFVSDERWRGFSVAAMKQLSDEMVLYAGGGYSEETVYQQYFDSQENRGVLGWYWVEDPDESRSGLNLVVGGMLRIAESVRIQFGGETVPMGFTIGLSYVFGGP